MTDLTTLQPMLQDLREAAKLVNDRVRELANHGVEVELEVRSGVPEIKTMGRDPLKTVRVNRLDVRPFLNL